jgi:ankyrin repeat protein
LFKLNACVQITFESKEFALSEIIKNNFPQEMIFELLQDGCVDPKAMRSHWGQHRNCLHVAAYNGFDSIVKLLLQDARVNPSALDSMRMNCVELSAWNGHVSTVKLLLDDGRSDPSLVDGDGNNCLHLSALRGRYSTVKLLLDDGRADPSAVASNGNNCIHLSARNGHDSTVKLLLDDGRADPSVVNSDNLNCLSIASKLIIKKMIMEDARFVHEFDHSSAQL